MQKPPVIKSKGHKKTSAIEESYEKWSRFENFLKFAERKELKDRLKELDPPPLSNYVDPSTIDSINKARKDPASLVKKVKPGQEMMTTDKDKAQNIEKNKKRIAKMKDMYSMFLKMERGDDAEASEAD